MQPRTLLFLALAAVGLFVFLDNSPAASADTVYEQALGQYDGAAVAAYSALAPVNPTPTPTPPSPDLPKAKSLGTGASAAAAEAKDLIETVRRIEQQNWTPPVQPRTTIKAKGASFIDTGKVGIATASGAKQTPAATCDPKTGACSSGSACGSGGHGSHQGFSGGRSFGWRVRAFFGRFRGRFGGRCRGC